MKASLLLFAALVGCQALPESDPVQSVDWLVDHGLFDEAVRSAAVQVEAHPGDSQVRVTYQRASIAWHLDQARTLTFAGKDDEALAQVQLALAIQPDNQVVMDWNHKTRRKLGGAWSDVAQDLHSADDLPRAQAAYQLALEYRPDLVEAEAGLNQVRRQISWRDDLGETYYDQGVRAISDWRLELAHSRFTASGKYRPDDPRPVRRVTEVERELSVRHGRIALQLEKDGYHAAARNDFRVALMLNENNSEAEQGLARARTEALADEFLLKGRMATLRGEFTEAREILLEGKQISVARPTMFDEALDAIVEAQIKRTYQKAIDLEHDFRYKAAIAKFRQILAVREYYEDCRARMATLEDYVRDAAALYERIVKSTDETEALQLLRQIELFWPEYLDIRKRIQVLEGASVDSDA